MLQENLHLDFIMGISSGWEITMNVKHKTTVYTASHR